MMKEILFAGARTFLAVSASAQISISNSGHVIVGEKSIESSAETVTGGSAAASGNTLLGGALEADTTCVMTVDGSGLNHSGGRIAFGSKGMGSIGTRPTGVLELKSSKGLRFVGPEEKTIFNLMADKEVNVDALGCIHINGDVILDTNSRLIMTSPNQIELQDSEIKSGGCLELHSQGGIVLGPGTKLNKGTQVIIQSDRKN